MADLIQQAEAGARTWLLLTTSILFLALVFLAIWLYARRARRCRRPPRPRPLRTGAELMPCRLPCHSHVPRAARSCARPDLAGKRLKCPHCGLVVLLPSITTRRSPNVPPAVYLGMIVLLASTAVLSMGLLYGCLVERGARSRPAGAEP